MKVLLMIEFIVFNGSPKFFEYWQNNMNALVQLRQIERSKRSEEHENKNDSNFKYSKMP